jgi:hypothetical protein
LPFTWSVSRHHTHAACARRYFHAHLARDGVSRRLRQVSSLPAWVGSVVHEELAALIRAGSPPPDAEELLRRVVQVRLPAEWKASESGEGEFRLVEHELGLPVSPADKRQVVDLVSRSLRNALGSEVLAAALRAGPEARLALDEPVAALSDGTPVAGRVDLAFRDRERVIVVDWRTGTGELEPLRRAVLGLLAVGRGWTDRAQAVMVVDALLPVERFTEYVLDEPALARARKTIARSAAALAALEEAPIEAFPMVDRPQACRACSFRRLCFPR